MKALNSTKKTKILIFHKCPKLRLEAMNFFQDKGFSPFACFNIEQVEFVLNTFDIKVAFVGISGTHGHGIKILKLLKDRKKKIPTILGSPHYDNDVYYTGGKHWGVDVNVNEPYSVHELYTFVTNILKEKQIKKENDSENYSDPYLNSQVDNLFEVQMPLS